LAELADAPVLCLCGTGDPGVSSFRQNSASIGHLSALWIPYSYHAEMAEVSLKQGDLARNP